MRGLALLLCVTVAACGFTPVYERNTGQLDTIDIIQMLNVVTPGGWEGNRLKTAIENELQISDQPAGRYRLEAGINIVSEPFIVESDGLASRYTLRLSSPYLLYRNSDNALLKRGLIRRDVSYNVSQDADYSTFVSQEDALLRGINGLAEDYGVQIPALLADALVRSR